MAQTKIPHKCSYCNCQLYLENRVYWKGEYYCKEHWFKEVVSKPKKNTGVSVTNVRFKTKPEKKPLKKINNLIPTDVEGYQPKQHFKTVEQAVKYLKNHKGLSGNDPYCGWLIRYYGFGEHLTFWLCNSFIDFGIDGNTKIGWKQMEKVLIETANHLWEQEEKLKNFLN